MKKNINDFTIPLEEKNNEYLDILMQYIISSTETQIPTDFLIHITHNVNSILTTIIGRIQLLEQKLRKEGNKGVRKDSKLKDIAILLENTQKLTDIIWKMQDKIRRDRNEKNEWLNLNELCRAELNFWEIDQFFKDEIEKRYSFSKKIPVFKGFYHDFSLTFNQIIKNALEAMKDSPLKKLTVSTFFKDGCITLKIKDTGSGIPHELSEKIFRPFFTTKTATKEKNKLNIGMGLYYVRSLMSKYHADVKVKNAPSETVFTINLPIK